jgi:hypothetical protein
MKTLEQVVKALEYRINMLEQTMDTVEKEMIEKEELKGVYWSSFERHEELSTLLTYIEGTNEQTGCGSTGGKSGSCKPCKNPCGAKSNDEVPSDT